MLCQNCGRRASDKLSFCPNCGAVASPDSPGLSISSSGPATTSISSMSSPRSVPARPQTTRSSQLRSVKYKTTTSQRPAAQGGSGFGSMIVFMAFVFAAAWWFTKTDDFDLITFIRSAIESNLNQERPAPSPPPQPRPIVRPPATVPGSTGRRATEAAPPAGDKGATVPTLTYRGATPPDIEGLTQSQVEQRLGTPTRRVNGGDGVNIWVYQYPNGGSTLIVYFYKDRASLKPPR